MAPITKGSIPSLQIYLSETEKNKLAHLLKHKLAPEMVAQARREAMQKYPNNSPDDIKRAISFKLINFLLAQEKQEITFEESE